MLRNSFYMKLTGVFLLATIVPLILISIIFYQINMSTSRDKITDTVQLTNKQIVQQLEDRLSQMLRVSDTVQYYIYNLPTDKIGSLSEQINAFSILRTNISTLTTAFDFKHTCVFLNSDYLFSNEGLMFYSLDRLEDFHIFKDTLPVRSSDYVWRYIPDQTFPFMLDKSYAPIDSILCLRTLTTGTTVPHDYVYFISIDARELSTLFSSAYMDTDITGYLTDESGCIMASSDREAAEAKTQFSKEEITSFQDNSPYKTADALYYTTRLSNRWLYVSKVSNSYIRANTSAYIRTFLITIILLMPFVIIALILITKSLTKRITLLSDSASKVCFTQNQFQAPLVDYVKTKPVNDYDDVDRLAITYNQMIQTIYENIGSITELRAQEESLKYQLLQSLINPHFLYNILDSIAVCNRIGKPELANKMIMNLTKFYRMTLRKSDELITIRDELDIAELYMELESICRGGNFTWHIDMDEDIENFLICKFTLQPFIENSILHGMQGMNRHLHIHIEIRYSDDTIMIFIQDNGNGIPPEKLQELKSSLQSGQIDTSKHFGICNVNARISSELFGYGFIEIDSVSGEGTSVKIEFQQLLP